MNNRHPTELLSAYLDGEVTDVERQEVSYHLHACEGCRALLDDFRTMAAAAAQEPPPPAPAGMVARVVAALGSPAPKPRRVFFPWLPLPLAVAAGLFVAVTGTWVLLRRPPERQPAAVAQAERESRPPEQMTPDDLARRYRVVAPPASESESEEVDRPATTPPPVVAGAHPEKDDAPALRSLGNVDRARKQASAAAREPPGAEAGRVAAYFEAGPDPGGRSIVFEFRGTKGTLTEAGLVTLALDHGTCSVDLSAAPAAGEEVRSIFRLAAPAPRSAARAGESKESTHLRESGTAAAGAAEGATEQATEEKKAERPVRLIRVLSSASRPIEAANAGQVEERLRRLLEVAARDLIESRCGGPSAQAPHGE